MKKKLYFISLFQGVLLILLHSPAFAQTKIDNSNPDPKKGLAKGDIIEWSCDSKPFPFNWGSCVDGIFKGDKLQAPAECGFFIAKSEGTYKLTCSYRLEKVEDRGKYFTGAFYIVDLGEKRYIEESDDDNNHSEIKQINFNETEVGKNIIKSEIFKVTASNLNHWIGIFYTSNIYSEVEYAKIFIKKIVLERLD